MANLIIDWKFVGPTDGWEVEPDAVAWIDVALLGAAWRIIDQYIEPAGRANNQDDRYAKAGGLV